MIMKRRFFADNRMDTKSTELSAHSKLIYIALWLRAEGRRRWFVGPEQMDLGSEVGASKRTTYRSTAQLRDLGLIRIKQRRLGAVSWSDITTYYWIS